MWRAPKYLIDYERRGDAVLSRRMHPRIGHGAFGIVDRHVVGHVVAHGLYETCDFSHVCAAAGLG